MLPRPTAALIGVVSVAAAVGVGHLAAALVAPSASPPLAVGGAVVRLAPLPLVGVRDRDLRHRGQGGAAHRGRGPAGRGGGPRRAGRAAPPGAGRRRRGGARRRRRRGGPDRTRLRPARPPPAAARDGRRCGGGAVAAPEGAARHRGRRRGRGRRAGHPEPPPASRTAPPPRPPAAPPPPSGPWASPPWPRAPRASCSAAASATPRPRSAAASRPPPSPRRRRCRRARTSPPSGTPPVLTPNADFYRIDAALRVPAIEAADWTPAGARHGRPGAHALLRRPRGPRRSSSGRHADLRVERGGGPAGLHRPLRRRDLRALLLDAGVQGGADQLLSTSVDGWTAGTPTATVLEPDRGALLAVGMNGEALPREHGFPVRMVVPGLYGYVSATKWLTDLELTTFDARDSYWVQRGWAPGPGQDPVADRRPAGVRGVPPGPSRWPGRRGRSTSAWTACRCAPTAARGRTRSWAPR